MVAGSGLQLNVHPVYQVAQQHGCVEVLHRAWSQQADANTDTNRLVSRIVDLRAIHNCDVLDLEVLGINIGARLVHCQGVAELVVASWNFLTLEGAHSLQVVPNRFVSQSVMRIRLGILLKSV